MLEIKDLHVKIKDKTILNGINLSIEGGKVHALMGPNGSGKSTLAQVLAGNPNYTVTKGTITLNGVDITTLSPDERAKLGLFVTFQYPTEVDGVRMFTFLHQAYIAIKEEIAPMEFLGIVKTILKKLSMDEKFLDRTLNVGFSGGEKKKSEILQLLLSEPKYAILDETDSGLDIDALKTVSAGIKEALSSKDAPGVVLITHYRKILDYISPDIVLVIKNGKIVKTGGGELVDTLEETGFGTIENDS